MQPETPSTRSTLAQIFLTPHERRLRSGWRLALHGMLFLALIIPLALPFALLYIIPEDWLRLFLGDLVNNRDLLIGAPPQLLAIFLSVYLARRFIDRRSFGSLGMTWGPSAGRDLAAGIFIAAPMIALIFGIQWGMGWLQVSEFAWQTHSLLSMVVQILSLFGIFVLVGFGEELFFRGYWQTNLAEGLNFRWAAVISSLIFAIFHIGNPGFDLKALAGLTLAGLFFVFSVQQGRSLWLAIGLHIGWNFFEGPFFGFQVSGLEAFRLIGHEIQGPAIWTGGNFGPEAGLVLIPALLLGMLLISRYTRSRQPAGSAASQPFS